MNEPQPYTPSAPQQYLHFADCLEKCRDGGQYVFTHPNLKGFFYKAPYPEDPNITQKDKAVCALTYWDKTPMPNQISPVFLLDDFDRNDWDIKGVEHHPSSPHFNWAMIKDMARQP